MRCRKGTGVAREWDALAISQCHDRPVQGRFHEVIITPEWPEAIKSVFEASLAKRRPPKV